MTHLSDLSRAGARVVLLRPEISKVVSPGVLVVVAGSVDDGAVVSRRFVEGLAQFAGEALIGDNVDGTRFAPRQIRHQLLDGIHLVHRRL